MTELDLLISPAQLTYPADGAAPRFRATYDYVADGFDEVSGSFLFWGPYLDLDAGIYVLNFLGEVEGGLSVEFIHDSGRMRIRQVTLDQFETPACVVLVQSVKRFEIRGVKTRALARLRLEGIRLERVYAVPGAS